jgi:hypothetical protein
MHQKKNPAPSSAGSNTGESAVKLDESPLKKPKKTGEIDGPKGLEPTRYGDWEKAGRCIDF